MMNNDSQDADPNAGDSSAATPDKNWETNNPTGRNGLIAIDKVGDKIRFFHPVTYEEEKVLDIKNHHEVAISPDHKTAYVSEFGKFAANKFVQQGNHVTLIDLDIRDVVHRIHTGDYKGPHGMRFDDAGGMWVIFEETGELGLIDLGKNTLVDVFDIGAADTRPPFIELLPDCSKIYISSKLGDLVVFSVESRSVAAVIDVPFGTEGITVSPDGSRIVVAENTEQCLLVIDTSTDQIVERIPLAGSVMSSPRRSRLVRVRFSLDGAYLISANYAGGVVHIHDGARLDEQVMLPVAKGPQGIAFTADNRKAIVSNHDSGVATIIDLDKKLAEDWFEFGQGIETMTFY